MLNRFELARQVGGDSENRRQGNCSQNNARHLGRMALTSSDFVQHLDAGNRSVVYDRFKGEIQFSLGGRLQMADGFRYLVEFSPFLNDVEIVQQCLPVAHHFEESAIVSRRCGTEVELGKVKNESVRVPCIDRNRISEMPKPLPGK